jgi:hypothetical protein
MLQLWNWVQKITILLFILTIKSHFYGCDATPEANPLTVIAKVRKMLPELEKTFPPSLHSSIVLMQLLIHASYTKY